MKTTILLLSIILGIVSNQTARIKHTTVRTNCTSTEINIMGNSNMLAKADSSNHYIYIISKHDYSNTNVSGRSLDQYRSNFTEYQNINKKIHTTNNEDYFTDNIDRYPAVNKVWLDYIS